MLFVAGIVTGAFAYNEEKPVEIRQTEPSKVLVAFKEAPQGPIVVKIMDEQNQLVLRDRITKTEAFAKRYDLNALPEGKYQIQVADAFGNLSSSTVNTTVVSKPEVYSRVTAMGPNQFRLLVSSLEAKEVTVQIFDGNELIHSEVVENPQGLHKVYTISKPAYPEAISFKVSTAGGFTAYVASK
ncbi:hypothetical protein Aconfl_14800 [Algoriphagus confluentis]|uniref:Uncharacterized protein n=2 Tax=Algoriphagus confluentis TaxID=1697556 RepID=A0ABQ6PPV4_9BACT|nr:hypothetical protein Aconfl_14800 [Algoriphagus confluentis]